VAHREKQNAPAPLPQNEEKQFTTLHFKKVEGDRTIFDLEASKSTDLRGQDISLLEDVKIKVFGKNGDRNDVIHTQSCRYAKTDGSIQCDGKVQFELQSAEDAARVASTPAGKPNIIHIDTSGVTFERATGRAQTVQLVKFSFTNGSGDGVGALYQSEQGQLRLIRDVHIQMQPAAVHFHLRRQRSFFFRRGLGCRLHLDMHVADQSQLALLGLVECPHPIAAAIRERKFHQLQPSAPARWRVQTSLHWYQCE